MLYFLSHLLSLGTERDCRQFLRSQLELKSNRHKVATKLKVLPLGISETAKRTHRTVKTIRANIAEILFTFIDNFSVVLKMMIVRRELSLV